ncbi:zinc finger protein 862-like [Asterias amurensis]|uniref:zinc finger protein 862-like n=1 Tax=Asterias amurensis TaxID=7602 RepID=UPI003AB55D20
MADRKITNFFQHLARKSPDPVSSDPSDCSDSDFPDPRQQPGPSGKNNSSSDSEFEFPDSDQETSQVSPPDVDSSDSDQHQLKTIKKHLTSDMHKMSSSARDPSQLSIGSAVEKASEKTKAAFSVALKTVFWLAKEEIANRKFKPLLEFLRHLGVTEAQDLIKGGNARYDSPHIFNELLLSLSDSIKKNMTIALKNSPFVGIGVDESTDRSQEKHLVVVIRYIAVSGEVVTSFLQCVEVRDGTSKTLYSAVHKTLASYKVPIRKVVGLGTDGASAVASDINGLNGLITADNPYCIFVHCVCHRLNLAVSQASQKVKEMQALRMTIAAIYNFIQLSPKKLQMFKDIASLMDISTLTFKRLYEIRWLSMGQCVKSIIRNYAPLIVLASQEADDGDPVASGLYQQLTSYKCLALLHLAGDVLTATNHLSMAFQKNDISFATVRTRIQDCLDTLDGFKTQPGFFLEELEKELDENDGNFHGESINFQATRGDNGQDQGEIFKQVRNNFLGHLEKNIHSRFPDVELLEAMQIFEPAAYPDNSNALTIWGNNHLQTLLNHFGKQQESRDGYMFDPLVDADQCKGEFLPFKRLVYRNLTEVDTDTYITPTKLMERLFHKKDPHGNRSIYKGMFSLMSLCMCVMVGNAEAERIFSCQNRIKSSLRSLLTIDHLDQLMRVSYNHSTLEDFPFNEALNLFKPGKRRL